MSGETKKEEPLDLLDLFGRVDETLFSLRTRVTNQAAHGKVSHQAAPGHILGYLIMGTF